MRDVCIKTTTSENHKRKNLSISETINMDGFIATAEKKYAYYVSEQSQIDDPEKFKAWMSQQSQSYQKKDRHVSICKIYNQKTGIGQMIYRVIGSFYVVQDLHVFAIVFMHSIKYDMVSADRIPDRYK